MRSYKGILFIFCLILFFSDSLISQPRGKKKERAPTGKIKERKDDPADSRPIDSIVIPGKRIPVMDDATTGTLITAEDIRDRSDKSLNDALADVPGLKVEMHSKGLTRVKIRGFDQDKIVILLDDIPINDIFSTDVDISLIPLTSISEIIINRGATSALYGTLGAAGSIHIKTRKPKKVFAEANFEYGEFKNHSAGFAAGAPIGKFYFWVAGSILDSSGYRPSRELDPKSKPVIFNSFIRYDLYGYNYENLNFPAGNDFINDTGKLEHTNFQKRNIFGRGTYKFNSHVKVGINGSYNHYKGKTNHFQHSCIGDYKIDDLVWKEPVFDIQHAKDIKKAALRNRSFEWPIAESYTVNPFFNIDYDKFKLRSIIYYTLQTIEQIGYASTDHTYTKENAAVISPHASHYDPFRDIKTYTSTGMYAVPTFKIAHWNRLSFALALRRDSFLEQEGPVSALESPDIVETRYSTKLFPVNYLQADYVTIAVEDEIYIRPRIRISAGISYDAQDFTKFKTRKNAYIYEDAYIARENTQVWGTRESVNPVFGIVFDAIRDVLKLRTAGSIKSRFPKLGEYEKIPDLTHDYKLRTERSRNWNAGVKWILLGKRLEFKADYFYSYIKDRIAKVRGGEEPPVNIEKVISHGAETTLVFKQKRVLGIMDVSFSFGYTYTKVRNRDVTPEEKVNMGEYIELTPIHQFTGALKLKFTSKTMFHLWGYAEKDQILYTMKHKPPPEEVIAFYSTDYFEPVSVNNPTKINIKISQEIDKHVQIYFLCKNILDDYNANPFNPGPGRMFFFGADAKL